jgi:hypothetical protein
MVASPSCAPAIILPAKAPGVVVLSVAGFLGFVTIWLLSMVDGFQRAFLAFGLEVCKWELIRKSILGGGLFYMAARRRGGDRSKAEIHRGGLHGVGSVIELLAPNFKISTEGSVAL